MRSNSQRIVQAYNWQLGKIKGASRTLGRVTGLNEHDRELLAKNIPSVEGYKQELYREIEGKLLALYDVLVIERNLLVAHTKAGMEPGESK